MIQKDTKKGILLSFVSLVLLGIMPVISNSRPMAISALNFSLYLSVWQLIFAAPVFYLELKFHNQGIFNPGLPGVLKKKAVSIILVTGVMFGLSTHAYVLSMENAGAVSAAIAIQACRCFRCKLYNDAMAGGHIIPGGSVSPGNSEQLSNHYNDSDPFQRVRVAFGRENQGGGNPG